MRQYIQIVEAASQYKQQIEIIKTNYASTALAPVMSAATVNYHYGKLAHGYAERFNKGEGDKTFNYAGAWLHNVFFMQFRSPKTLEPNGPVGNLIKQKFKTYSDFKDKFKEEALKLQGSGWVYLARDGSIKTIKNHQVRPDILILVDMWEHAYNLDYGTDKKKYLDNIWRIIDWNVINTRWGQAYQ
jgi:Fe-Mn family superoxide dismutase